MRRGGPCTLLALGLMIAGCTARRPVATRPAPASLPSVADLEAALAYRRTALYSLRALARLRYRDPTESNSAKQAIAVARPDRLRVEVLSLFGSVFVLAADDGVMAAYARSEHTLYRGQASADNLWRYARVGLPVTDLVDIVLGTPPHRHAQRARVSFDAGAGAVRLVADLDRGAQLVWFSDDALPIAVEERSADGRPQWHASFGEYEDHGGLAVATRIGLELPPWQRMVEISLQDVDVNPPLDRSIFALQIPPGSTVVELDRVTD